MCGDGEIPRYHRYFTTNHFITDYRGVRALVTTPPQRPAPTDLTVRAVERDQITAQFLDEANVILQRAFDTWPSFSLPVSATDHLAWKVDGPLPGHPAALAAEIDRYLVGIRTTLARHIVIHGEPKLFLHYVDAAVHPDFQGRGVNGAIRGLMQQDPHSLYDLAIDDGVIPTIVHGREQLGGTRPFANPVRPYRRPLRRPTFRGSRPTLRTAFVHLASIAARARARFHLIPAVNVTIRTIDTFDASFDEFCARACAVFDFVPERTAAFLNWRYADPRAGTFTIRIAECDGTLLGYSVTTHHDELTFIADILVAPDESDRPSIGTSTVSALVQDALDLARHAKSTSVTCWLPQRHPYSLALRAHGFVSLGRTTPLVYRAAEIPWERLAFLDERDSRIHITHGDTDLV